MNENNERTKEKTRNAGEKKERKYKVNNPKTEQMTIKWINLEINTHAKTEIQEAKHGKQRIW